MHERETRNTIFSVLSAQLSDYAATGIDGLVIRPFDDELIV